ncbi:MAG: hypothetical protein ABIQ88_15120 [Chitinophagaceae bacterium]
MQKNGIRILLISFLFGCTTLIGQVPIFRSFSFKEGLNSYAINKTIQDKYGFIWVGTQDGIFRFNGKSFEGLKNESSDELSPSGNFFYDIYSGPDGRIYAADCNNGFDVIDPSSLKTQRIRIDTSTYAGKRLRNLWLTNIIVDTRNTTWIGNRDFFAFKKSNDNEYTIVDSLPRLNSKLDPFFIKQISANYTCISISNYGLLLYNLRTLRNKKLDLPEKIARLAVNIKDVWIEHDTLYGLSDNLIFKGFFNDSGWHYDKSYFFPRDRLNGVNCFVKERQDVFWIGTNAGLVKYHTDTDSAEIYQAGVRKRKWLVDNTINSLMIDTEKNLWISTATVLQMVHLGSNPFHSFSGEDDKSDHLDHLYSLLQKTDTEIFAAGTNGLFVTNILSGRSKIIPGSNKFGVVHYLQKIKEGFWIVSTDKGMCIYSSADNRICQTEFLKFFPEWSAFRERYFNSACEIGNISYWASDEEEGLFKWDRQKRKVWQFKAGTAQARGVAENRIHNIKMDREGFLYLLTDNTIEKFDIVKDSVVEIIKDIRNLKNAPPGVYFDMYDDGRFLWFGTYGGGINKYEKYSHQWTQLSETNGLCNNSVYGLLPESDSIVWASTNMGLSRINSRSGLCSNYYYEDGLQDNCFDEKGYLSFKNKMYFGGINGFTEIDASLIPDSAYPFPIYIYKLEYYKGREKQTIHALKWDDISLPAGTNSVSISLAALNFNDNHHVRFSYKIDGKQDNYVNGGYNEIINLNALTYGSYFLKVGYWNKDGFFVKDVANIKIFIAAKWYQTDLFKLIILLSFVALLYIFYRYRLSQVNKQQLIRRQLSNDLHDDIGSTLNSIKVYSDLIMIDPSKKEYLLRIKEGAQSAISSTRDLIWVMDSKLDTLNDVIYRFENFAYPLASANSIDLTKDINERLLNYKLDKDEKKNLFMIMKETFNNCIKYSDCSVFNFIVQIDEHKKMSITLSDNGNGFDQDRENKGNGLQNIRYRAAQAGYNVSIYSKKGSGTTIKMVHK